ncbi:MAG TPA: Zn-dependent alcohol dehydrogenase [Actinomycetota bacterium]
MRAAVVRELNVPVEISDQIELAGPGPGEVRVKMVAAGVCHSDISGTNGTFPMPLPFVIGHEGAGEIIAVGEGVSTLAVGDHVILSWMPPCGSCRFCLGGQPHLCLNEVAIGTLAQRFSLNGEQVYGFSGTGTFAEETVVSHKGAIKIPDDVPLDVASLIGCGVMTGVGAVINTARVEPGSSVVVIGAGGVGISVIQGARIAGAAEIIAVDPVEAKHEMARSFGATHAAAPEGLADLKQELTEGHGFDYAFEVVGHPATIRSAYDATRRGGTTVVVGAGKSDAIVEFNAYELFFDEKRILGCLYGSADVRRDFHRLIRLWRQGKLDLEGMITRRVTLDEVNDAFDAMMRGEVIRQVIEFK